MVADNPNNPPPRSPPFDPDKIVEIRAGELSNLRYQLERTQWAIKADKDFNRGYHTGIFLGFAWGGIILQILYTLIPIWR